MTGAYTPQTFSPPGSILEELMEERGLDPHDLALDLGLSEQGLADFLCGRLPLSEALSEALERALGVERAYWLNHERLWQQLGPHAIRDAV
jgi:plasmid maintenance system antidote protein VapI